MHLASAVSRALSVCGALAFLALRAPAAPCDILLNEILAGPARDWSGDGVVSARDDEWIEIWNQGPGAMDLSTYYVSDADSTERFAFTGMLGPGEYRVVYGSQAVDWQRANGKSVAGLSLNNSGDTVRLWRIVGPDTVLMDAYAYKSHEGANDRASGRRPDGGAWALFDELNPYAGSLDPTGTGCSPTPGSSNTCPVTRSEPLSWGKMKSMYR